MNTIKKTVSSIWNSVKSAVGSIIGQIYNVIHSGFERAISYAKGLASQAFSWGRELIMGIVNGIKSAVGAVTDAVNGVANKIRSVLHFSVSDEGQLTDYKSWMPDFMAGLARGIEESKSLMAKSMDGVAANMVINPQIGRMEIATATTSAGTADTLSGITAAIRECLAGATGQSGDIVIPVYLGGMMLLVIVNGQQQRANLRSGGR